MFTICKKNEEHNLTCRTHMFYSFGENLEKWCQCYASIEVKCTYVLIS
jgi:hypothetical protein